MDNDDSVIHCTEPYLMHSHDGETPNGCQNNNLWFKFRDQRSLGFLHVVDSEKVMTRYFVVCLQIVVLILILDSLVFYLSSTSPPPQIL